MGPARAARGEDVLHVDVGAVVAARSLRARACRRDNALVCMSGPSASEKNLWGPGVVGGENARSRCAGLSSRGGDPGGLPMGGPRDATPIADEEDVLVAQDKHLGMPVVTQCCTGVWSSGSEAPERSRAPWKTATSSAERG